MKRIAISAAAFLLMLLMGMGLANPAFAEGTAPVAENLDLRTYRGVSVGGMLSAYDPDGDVVSYEITTSPVKGSVELKADGSFVYTPKKKRGRDYFGYKAKDAQGNLSQEATVLIRIEKQRQPVVYEDMDGRAGAYAAAELCESGLFVGDRIGTGYCFHPDRAVTRGEFLSLCMLATDQPLLEGVMRSGYSDDERLSDSMRQLAATAALTGIQPAGGSLSPDSVLTKGEAAAMLNAALGLYDVALPEEAAPESMLQACMNLQSAGVVGADYTLSETLCREEAAQMIVRAMETHQEE
ncbi:MAG: hypothetical protein K6F56_09890 [Oscillospiraceae bacterium]|nr:hypothetical protein [Oscillospiraceae bacterium]